ncbi:Voltage gated chloride channel [Carnobacterium iners]|nr:Voltage gated chloride channel [Carnobacterium iners]
MIPLVIFGTWLTHLFGGSASREDVAVQIGAVVGHSVSRKLPYKEAGKILLVASMAAGFGGLFQTPIAGIFFAMEVLMIREIKSRAVIPTAIAAFSASTTSHLLGLEKFTAKIDSPGAFVFSSARKIIPLGLAFGIVDGIFAFGLKKAKQLAAFRFPDPYKRIFFIRTATSLLSLLLHTGRYSGLGTSLIGKSFETGTIYNYDWVLKCCYIYLYETIIYRSRSFWLLIPGVFLYSRYYSPCF